MKQAEWNDITWGSNLRQMAHIKSFKLSQGIKTENNDSESNTSKTIVKGLEPENLTISYDTGFVIGIDPRGEFEMLKKCAGMQDKFIIGGVQISKQNFCLDEISLANTTTDLNGQILTGEVTINLSTDSNTSSKGGKGTKETKKTAKPTKKGSITV